MISSLKLLLPSNNFAQITRTIATTSKLSSRDQGIQKRSKVRVVDNSEIGKQAMMEGKPPKVIHVYVKKVTRGTRAQGLLGDKVLLAIKGQMKKAVIVGLVRKQAPLVPKFDSNNVVLIDDKGTPLGNRILVPIPNLLRNEKYGWHKLLAIATKFV